MTDNRLPEESGFVDEINLLDLVTAVGEEKFFISMCAAVIAVVGLAVSLLITPVFTAKTTLLPPQQGQGVSSALSASLGALAGIAGLGAGAKAQDEMYVGLLKSDSLANALNDRFKLKDRYEAKTSDAVRGILSKNVRIAADRKSTFIVVEVDDRDPKFAADLCNAYVDELHKLLGRIAVTEAQQRRVFYELQMGKAKDELASAELAVKKSQDKGGLVSVDAQTQALIGAAAQLRGQIVAKEVQLQSLKPYAGPDNPELRRLGSELSSLRAQLGKMESGSSAGADTGDASKDALGNLRLYRELKYQEAVYSAMMQQFQLAKADEAKDAPLIQQIDVAFPPETKSKPARSLIVLTAALAGLFLGLIVAFLRRAARSTSTNPKAAAQWRSLRKAWSWRRT